MSQSPPHRLLLRYLATALMIVAISPSLQPTTDDNIRRGILNTTFSINGKEYSEAIPASFPVWMLTRLSNKRVVISTANRLGCNYISNLLFFGTKEEILDDSIVILDRGLCDFAQKIKGAEMLGAAAVIMVNNEESGVYTMGWGLGSSEISIPSVMVSKAVGDAIREEVFNSTSTTTLGSLTILPTPCLERASDCEEGQYCEYVPALQDVLISEMTQQKQRDGMNLSTDSERVGYCVDGCDSSASCPADHFCYVRSDIQGCTGCNGKGPIFCSLLDIRGDIATADSCWEVCSETWQVCSESKACPAGGFCTYQFGSNGYCEECDNLQGGALDCQGFVGEGKFSCLDSCFDACSMDEPCSPKAGEFCVVDDENVGNAGHCASILACDANERCPEGYYCSSRYQRCTSCDKLSPARCLISQDEVDNGCIDSCSENWDACSEDGPCSLSKSSSFCALATDAKENENGELYCIECDDLKGPHDCNVFEPVAAKEDCINSCFQPCKDDASCGTDQFCDFQLGDSGACVYCKIRVGTTYLSAMDCASYPPAGEVSCINSCFQVCSADSECLDESSFCSYQLDAEGEIGACIDCSSVNHPSDCIVEYDKLGKESCLSNCFNGCSDTSPCPSDYYCYFVDEDATAGACMRCPQSSFSSFGKGGQLVAMICMELPKLSQQSCVDSCYLPCQSSESCPESTFCDYQISSSSGACASCSAWLTDLGPISMSDCSEYFSEDGAAHCIEECFNYCSATSICDTDQFCSYQLGSSGGACIDCSTILLASDCFEHFSESGVKDCISNCFVGCSSSEPCEDNSFCLLDDEESDGVCINCAGIEEMADCGAYSLMEVQASCMQTCFNSCSEEDPCTDGSICQFGEFGGFCRSCARSRLRGSCTYGDVVVDGRKLWGEASPLSPIESAYGRLVECAFGDDVSGDGGGCKTSAAEPFICFMNNVGITEAVIRQCTETGGKGAIFVSSNDQDDTTTTSSTALSFSPYQVPVVIVPGKKSAALLLDKMGSLVRVNIFTGNQNSCNHNEACGNGEFCAYELSESGFCRGCNDVDSCFFAGLNQRGAADCAFACKKSLDFANCKLCPQDISASSFGTAGEGAVCSFCPENDIQHLDRKVPMFGENATCSSMDFLIDSLQIDAENINCRLSQSLNYACGCKGSGYGGASSTSKQAALAWVPRCTALLSLLGSTFIIVNIVRDRKRRKKLLGLLMVMMSVFDVFGSIAYAFTTLPIPADEYIYGAIGSEASCVAQAFFIQLGTIAAYFNVSIGFYYVLVIKYGWHERRCDKYRKYFLSCPVIVGLVFAFVGIPYYGNMITWCNNTSKWWPESAIIIAIIAATVMMLLVIMHVYQEEKASKRWRSGTSSSLTKDVMWQAIYYLFAFYLVWPPYLALQYLWAQGYSFDNYGFILAASTMVTMQGFWNCVAYVKRRWKAKWNGYCGFRCVTLERVRISFIRRRTISSLSSRLKRSRANTPSFVISSEVTGKEVSLGHIESQPPVSQEEQDNFEDNASENKPASSTKISFMENLPETSLLFVEEKKPKECNALDSCNNLTDDHEKKQTTERPIQYRRGKITEEGMYDNTESLVELLNVC